LNIDCDVAPRRQVLTKCCKIKHVYEVLCAKQTRKIWCNNIYALHRYRNFCVGHFILIHPVLNECWAVSSQQCYTCLHPSSCLSIRGHRHGQQWSLHLTYCLSLSLLFQRQFVFHLIFSP